jgi:2-polyprenyl-3-methyl-5-hydroxy-6-metoxy-1,4-benzoquinol methylase
VKFGMAPEGVFERALLAALTLPVPLGDTLVGALYVRTLMTASRVGLFGALEGGDGTAEEVAARCGTDVSATKKLLNALVGCRYLRLRKGRYALTKTARTWMVPSAEQSLHDHMLMMDLTWRWLDSYEGFVRTGEPLDVHTSMSAEDWELYQRGMRAIARLSAPEVGLRTPVPKGATAMLDIGGSHGAFSVALCERHPTLRSTILDLPEAVETARHLLAEGGMSDRVTHQPADVREVDLGVEAYDLILISQLLHHFDEATNRDIVVRAARALRPGGYLVVQEIIRVDDANDADQAGNLMDLYFALLSEAGTLSMAEIAEWQRTAGLVPRKPMRFLTLPGTGQQAARKHP